MQRYHHIPLNTIHLPSSVRKDIKGGVIIEEEEGDGTIEYPLPFPSDVSIRTSPPTGFYPDYTSPRGVSYGISMRDSDPATRHLFAGESPEDFTARTLDDFSSGRRVPHLEDLAHAVYHDNYGRDLSRVGREVGIQLSRMFAEGEIIPDDINGIHDTEHAFRQMFANQRRRLETLERRRDRRVDAERNELATPGVNIVEDDI